MCIVKASVQLLNEKENLRKEFYSKKEDYLKKFNLDQLYPLFKVLGSEHYGILVEEWFRIRCDWKNLQPNLNSGDASTNNNNFIEIKTSIVNTYIDKKQWPRERFRFCKLRVNHTKITHFLLIVFNKNNVEQFLLKREQIIQEIENRFFTTKNALDIVNRRSKKSFDLDFTLNKKSHLDFKHKYAITIDKLKEI